MIIIIIITTVSTITHICPDITVTDKVSDTTYLVYIFVRDMRFAKT
jgi:hypothetical protein